MVIEHPLLNVCWSDVCRLFSQGFPPEVVSLGKDGETILPMFGQVCCSVSRSTVEGPTYLVGIKVRDGFGKIEFLIYLVSDLAHGVLQTTGQNHLGRYQEAFSLLEDNLIEELCQGEVLHEDDLVHTVNHTIGDLYILVSAVDGTIVVHIETVGCVSESNAQLAVVHVCQRKLSIVCHGELRGEDVILVCSIYDAVVYDDLLDGVAYTIGRECIPGRFGDDAFLCQVLQIGMYGIVGGSKTGIVSACCKQLFQSGIGYGACFYLAQQLCILAILRESTQITVYGVVLEYIACRCVDVLFACRQDGNHGQNEQMSYFHIDVFFDISFFLWLLHPLYVNHHHSVQKYELFAIPMVCCRENFPNVPFL